MDLKRLLGLRPKTETVVAIGEAIAAATAAQHAALGRIASLERDRGQRLLEADAAAVTTAERDLTESRAEAERLDALLLALRDRLEAAKAREARAKAEAAVAEVTRASDAFKQWWTNEYPVLAAKIRDGLLLEVAEGNARTVAHNAIAAAGAEGEDMSDVRLPDTAANQLWGPEAMAMFGLGSFVMLPAPDGPATHTRSPIWPPHG